jgi:ABC-type uncharacterized transport system permease subunit
MNHILKVIWLKLKNNMIKDWEYKTNLISAVAVQIVFLGVQLAFLGVIFIYVTEIQGWSLLDLFIYILVADASIMILFVLGLYFDDEVIYGTLNEKLVRPISEFVLYLQLDISTIIFFIGSIVSITIIAFVYPVNITIISSLFSILTLIITFPILILPFLIIRSFSFWRGKVENIENLLRGMTQSFDNVPVIILDKFFLTLFIIITPAGYFHWYLTTAILLNKISYLFAFEMLGIAIIIDIVLFWIFIKIYKKGLSRYEGFGG